MYICGEWCELFGLFMPQLGPGVTIVLCERTVNVWFRPLAFTILLPHMNVMCVHWLALLLK